jgi:microcystin-dependent protein
MSLLSNVEDVLTRIATEFKTLRGRVMPAGGTAGQVITKINSTDYNASWQDPQLPVHDHEISEVVGLQTTLDGKQKVITQSSTAPASPAVGDLWIET